MTGEESNPLSGDHDPAWAERMARLEAEFERVHHQARKEHRAEAARRERLTEGARKAHEPKKPRRSKVRFGVVYVVVAIVAAAIGYGAIYRHSAAQRVASAVPVMNAPPPIATESSAGNVRRVDSGADSTSVAPVADSDDPFSGSPAQSWPSADRGVIMPEATSVGAFTAAQTQSALDLAHRFILDARTSTAVLTDHDVAALEQKVEPQELAQPHFDDGGQHSIFFPTRLATGYTLAAATRVNGTVSVTYVPKGDLGQKYLTVSANLVWAYALVPHAETRREAGSVVVLHENLVLASQRPNPAGTGKLFVVSDSYFVSNMDCAYFDQGLLALPRLNDPSLAPVPSGVVLTGAQPFDPREDLKKAGGSCL